MFPDIVEYMRKIFSGLLCLCLAFVMLFTFTGCKGKDEFRVAVFSGSLAPATFINSNGKPDGIAIDLAKLYARESNKKLKMNIFSFDGYLAAVQSGTHDALFCLTPMEERMAMFDFSDVYATFSAMFMARANDTSLDTCTTKEQIEIAVNGKNVGTLGNSSHDIYLRTVDGVTQTYFDDLATMIVALKNGQVDYVLWDWLVVNSEPVTNVFANNPEIKNINVPVEESDLAVAVKKGNTALLNEINELIASVKSDGRLDAIIEKYV